MADLTGFSQEDQKARIALVQRAKTLGLGDLTVLSFWLQRPIIPKQAIDQLQTAQREATLDESYTDEQVYNASWLRVDTAIEGLEAIVIDKDIRAPPPDPKVCDAMERWGVPPVKELVKNYEGPETDTVCDNLRERYNQYVRKLGNYIVFGGSRQMTERRAPFWFLQAVRALTSDDFTIGEYPYDKFVDYGEMRINARVDREEFLQSRLDYLEAKQLYDEWTETIKKPKQQPGGGDEPTPLPPLPGPTPAPAPQYAETAFTAPMFEPRKVLLQSIKKTGGFTIVDPAYVPWNSKYDYLWNGTR